MNALSDRGPAFPPQQNPDEMAMGTYGGIIIDSTAAIPGPFCAIKALVDSTFAAGTVSPSIAGTWTGKIIPKSDVIVGHFTSVQFSGTPQVIAYYGHRKYGGAGAGAGYGQGYG